MIIVKLQGGLGNQMFQYAVGRALSLRNSTGLSIDLSFLKKGSLGENVDYRNYGLDKFCISENIISEEELNRFVLRSKHLSRLKISWFNRITGYRLELEKTFYQKGLGYDPEFLSLSDNSYLIGYWQNAEYFKGFEEKIKEDFRFKHLPNKMNKDLLSEIKECESVSIHFRRGDFKNLPVLGTTNLDFYKKAIDYLTERLDKPVLYFFSDEMNWVKESFSLITDGCRVCFVEINNSPGNEADDLRLMSGCKHNIIGNSTFGWWGAWLNSNKYKIVIAPQRLFNDTAIDQQLQGMIPDNWIRL